MGAILAPWLQLRPGLYSRNFHDLGLIAQSDTWQYALFGIWQRFDSIFYLHIARVGYDLPKSVVFYPLYPALIRLTGLLVPNPYAAALLVSTTATFFAFLGLERLFSRSAVIRAAVWPASFVFFAIYPESVLLALTVWAVHFGNRRLWLLAGILGLAAGLTKAVGALVVLPLLILAWRARDKRAWPVLLSALGPPLFAAWIHFLGLPSAASQYPVAWKTQAAWPWDTLWTALASPQPNPVILLNLAMIGVVVWAALKPPIRPEYALYALASAAIFLTKKTVPILQSTLRYVVVVFPIYAALAPNRLWLAVLALLNLLSFYLFLEWYLIV